MSGRLQSAGTGLAVVLVGGGLQTALGAERKGIPAFPGAEGFGADTPGGRGGRVIEVTNLKPDGPGSLQEACRARGARIVVFRVGGTIPIERDLVISEPFATIAGQTAPGDGICLRGAALVVRTHDVVVRYLRVRTGDNPVGPDPENRDALGIAGEPDRVYNIVIDHCSFSWAIDENVQTWYGPRDVTIQWCITSESLTDSLHPKGPHGMGMILGSRDNTLTIHHCLFAHNNDRNPLLGDTGKNKGPTICDFRSNVVYNHGPWSCSNVRGTTHLNYVDNYIKLGPNGIRSRPRGLGFREGKQKAFVRGNLVTASSGQRGGPDRAARPDAPMPVPAKLRVGEPITAPEVTTESAQEAYESVLRYAGACLPVRDVVDVRVVEEVRTGAGRIIDTQKDVGGWPEYRGGTPERDSDRDGMPDLWERRYRLDPASPADGPRDADGDGDTNVEEFLNGTNPREAGGAPRIPHPEDKVKDQEGNVSLRGANARKHGEALRAEEARPAASFPRTEFVRRVRRSRKEVAEFLGLEFVRVPEGGYTTKTGVRVTLTRPFELTACEITQHQWETVMGTKPWSGRPYAKDGSDRAVTYVSWIDCEEFVARLRQTGGPGYRLPTEAEMMYAARAGTRWLYGFEERKELVTEHAWCAENTVRVEKAAAQPVGRKKPNPWGLYDVAGNVHEWCHDWYEYWYWAPGKKGPTKIDPTGPERGHYRVLRGASFYRRASQVLRYPSSAHRPSYRNFDVGFRVARQPQ